MTPFLDPPEIGYSRKCKKTRVFPLVEPRTSKNGKKGVQKVVPFWVPEGVWDPKWVIFGPPLKPPLIHFRGQKRSIWAQKGSKMGQKGVKKGSKWTILGSQMGPRREIGVIEHFSCTRAGAGG